MTCPAASHYGVDQDILAHVSHFYIPSVLAAVTKGIIYYFLTLALKNKVYFIISVFFLMCVPLPPSGQYIACVAQF